MNTMNYIGKIRIRSLEELNSNQNLLISSQELKSETNYVEKDSRFKQSQFKKNTNACTAELQEIPIVSFEAKLLKTERNCLSPTLKIVQPNSNRPIYNLIKSKEDLSLSGESSFVEIDQSHFGNICLSLEEEQSQSTQTLSKTFKELSDNSNIDCLPGNVSPSLVEGNIENDIRPEPPDDSFCLMELVETVFGVGCIGDDLNCLCPPIQLEIEEEESLENSEVSREHNYSIECETPEFEKRDVISFYNERISVQSNSEKLEIDKYTNLNPIKDPLLDSESEANYKPTNNSLDKVSLNLVFAPYQKFIAGTTFAVDDFRYGTVADATAIFLTHLHLDQYYKLNVNSSKPIYLSRTTAKVLQDLRTSNESMLNIMDLNNTITIDGVKVTALDANYCPGAIMLLFQLSCGFRILYTGNFHASSEMELNPFLKGGKIDLLYLDMSYISRKSNLSLRKVSCQSQEKSISDALILIRKFKEAHMDKRILFVFGHNVLGNEELWLQIADTFDFKVWADELRVKIFIATEHEEYTQRLVPNPQQADMHLIQHSNINHHNINEYWKGFKDTYDLVLAIKPNQWVNNKQRLLYKGEINIAEIEYSGHSNETEIRRFLAFLQPKRVITIVPAGKDHKMYPEVPLSWYKQKWFAPVMKQASMFDFFPKKA